VEEVNMNDLEETKQEQSSTSQQFGGRFEQPEQPELEAIATLVHETAQHYRGKSSELLALLRLLEALHQEIRDDLFQKSLPDNRQALYALLRDIETEGGWPYIHRMKLQAFLSNLLMQPGEELPDAD
jgi:hypothetical protein